MADNGPQIGVDLLTDVDPSLRSFQRFESGLQRQILLAQKLDSTLQQVYGKNTPQALQSLMSTINAGGVPNPAQVTGAKQAAKISPQGQMAQVISEMNKIQRINNAPFEQFQRQQERSERERNRFTNANQNVLGRLDSKGGAEFIQIQGAILRNFLLIGGALRGISSGARFVVQLDASFKQLQAISGTTATSMKALETALVSVSEKTKFTALEVAEAATILAQAGFSTKEIEDSIESVTLLATATGSTLAKAVDVSTSVLGVWNLQAAETANIANVMTAAINGSKLTMDKLALGLQFSSNIAAQSGVSYEELTVALGALANAGIRSGSTLGTGLRQLMIDLQAPTSKLERRLTTLGLSLADVDVRSNGLIGVMKNLRAAGFTSADAMQTLEVRAAAAFSAFANNLDFATEFRSTIVGTSAAARANAVQMQSLANKLLQLGSVLGTFIANAGAPFLEILKGAADGLVVMFQAASDAGPPLQVLTTAVATFVTLRFIRTIARMTSGLFAFAKGGEAAGAAMSVMQARAAATSATSRTLTASIAGLVGSVVGTAGLSLVIGAATTALFQLAEETETAEEKLDRLRGEVDRAKDEFNSTRTSVEAVGASIEMLTRRSESLANDDIMRGQVLGEVQQQFENLGLSIDSTAESTGSVIRKLQELEQQLNRGALEQAALRVDAARVSAQAQAQPVNNALNNSQALRRAGTRVIAENRDTLDPMSDPNVRRLGAYDQRGRIEGLAAFSGLTDDGELKRLTDVLTRSLEQRSTIEPNEILGLLGELRDSNKGLSNESLRDYLQGVLTQVQDLQEGKGELRSAEAALNKQRLGSSKEVQDFIATIRTFSDDVQKSVTTAKEITDPDARQKALYEVLDRSADREAELVKSLDALGEKIISDSFNPNNDLAALRSLNLRDLVAKAAGQAASAAESGEDNYFRNRKSDVTFDTRGDRATVSAEKRIAQIAATSAEIDEAEKRAFDARRNIFKTQKEFYEEEANRLGTDVSRKIRSISAEFDADDVKLRADFDKARSDLARRKNQTAARVIKQVIENIDNELKLLADSKQLGDKDQVRLLLDNRNALAKQLDDLSVALSTGSPEEIGLDRMSRNNAAQLAERRALAEYKKAEDAATKNQLTREKRVFANQARDYERQLNSILKTVDETTDRAVASATLAKAKSVHDRLKQASLAAFDSNPNNNLNADGADVEAIKDARQRLQDQIETSWVEDQKNFWNSFRREGRTRAGFSRRAATRDKRSILKKIRLAIGEADDTITRDAGNHVVSRLVEYHSELKAAALAEFDSSPDHLDPSADASQIRADREELVDVLAEQAKADIEQFWEGFTTSAKGRMRIRQRSTQRSVNSLVKKLSHALGDADELLNEQERGAQETRVKDLLDQIGAERIKLYNLNPVQLDKDFDAADFDAGLAELEDLIIEDTKKSLKDFGEDFQKGIEDRARTRANLINRRVSLTQGEISNLKAELGDAKSIKDVERIRIEVDDAMSRVIDQKIEAFRESRLAEGSDTPGLDKEQEDQLRQNLEADRKLAVQDAKDRAEAIQKKDLRTQQYFAKRRVKAIEDEIDAFLSKNEGASEGRGLDEVLAKYQEMNGRLIDANIEAFNLDPDNNFLDAEDQVKLEGARKDLRQGLVNRALDTIKQILEGAGLSGDSVSADDVSSGSAAAPGIGRQINDAFETYKKGAGRLLTVNELVGSSVGSLESNLKGFFTSVSDGSKSAGGAFKDLGRSMLETMRDVAASQAAKAFVGLLVNILGNLAGGFSSGFSAPSTAPGLHVGQPAGSLITAATGGIIPDNIGIRGRDSVPLLAMPGEGVLREKAVRSLGKKTVERLNDMGAAGLPQNPVAVPTEGSGESMTTNVWIVPQDQKPVPGPNDILAVVTDDMARNGQSAKLVKSISVGAA